MHNILSFSWGGIITTNSKRARALRLERNDKNYLCVKGAEMHLYTFDTAPNPKRLYHFMKFKGISITTTQIDLVRSENLGESYLSVNKLGTVPALVLNDGTILTEVIGICAYLESLHPNKPLLGKTALERAEVLSWDHYLLNAILLPIAEIFRNDHPAFENRALPGPYAVAQLPES